MQKEYKIKQLPEDFYVEEVPGYHIKGEGEFILYKMSKENLTTLDAIRQICETLHIQEKDIGYAGLKDKIASTVQYITIKKSNRQLEDNYAIGKIRLEKTGYRDEKLYPGCLESNNFVIVVRNIQESPGRITKMVNYYGDQRFSSNNIEIGRKLIKRDFEGAVKLIMTAESKNDIGEIQDNNYINYLQKLDQKILTLYAHAYQSYLWNLTADTYIALKGEASIDSHELNIPLLGFDMTSSSDIMEAVDEIMETEQITPRNLIIRELPRLSLESSNRKLYVEIKNLEVSELESDELNHGMKKCIVKFNIPRGSYGTECIRQMFSA